MASERVTPDRSPASLGRIRRWAPDLLALLFAGSAVIHLAAPHVYVQIVPGWLPWPHAIVVVSGVAELVCAAGLWLRLPWAGPAAVALLVAVFPANLQMAIDAGSHTLSGLADSRVVSYLRLPLQLPLIWAGWQARRVTPRRRGR